MYMFACIFRQEGVEVILCKKPGRNNGMKKSVAKMSQFLSLFLLSPSWRFTRNWCLNPHYNREKGGGLKIRKILSCEKCYETNCETGQRKSPFSPNLTKSRFDIQRLTAVLQESGFLLWAPAAT